MDQAAAGSVMRCAQSGRNAAGQLRYHRIYDGSKSVLSIAQISFAHLQMRPSNCAHPSRRTPRGVLLRMRTGLTGTGFSPHGEEVRSAVSNHEAWIRGPANSLRRGRQHHLRQKLLTLLLGAVALHGRGTALED